MANHLQRIFPSPGKLDLLLGGKPGNLSSGSDPTNQKIPDPQERFHLCLPLKDSIPGSGRSPGGGHSNPLQYSCLENPMDRGAWWATVHGVAKSRTRLKRLDTQCLPHPSISLSHTHTYAQMKSIFLKVKSVVFFCQLREAGWG